MQKQCVATTTTTKTTLIILREGGEGYKEFKGDRNRMWGMWSEFKLEFIISLVLFHKSSHLKETLTLN